MAHIPTDTKTHTRTKDAEKHRANHGDSCSAKKVDPDLMCLTSCGNDSTVPFTLPRCMGDAMVDKGAEEQTPCLLPMERRTLTAAGGLLPVGTASTAMRTIFLRPQFFLSFSEETKKSTTRTTNQLAPLSLQMEGYSNEIKANSGIGSWRLYRSSTRRPVSGRMPRVAYWMGSFGRCNDSRG